ncbi:MAG: glycosyltransferase [Bacteroidetes bacterium]|nr:glycosyltransferase [Bacteroidota bacterium]
MSEEIKKYNLTQNINFMGWVSYQESIKYQREADVLLLILDSDIPNACVVVHAKLFEYIFANRPILALLPDGAAKDIIIRTNTGIVVSPDNVNQISSGILKMFHDWEKNNFKFNPNWNEINKYNRKNLTQKLAQAFNSIS